MLDFHPCLIIWVPYALKYLGLPGMRDVNVNKYCIWHSSKSANNVWKMEYKKTCDLTLAEGLDLKQIRLDQDVQFFIDKTLGERRKVLVSRCEGAGRFRVDHSPYLVYYALCV
ncbi:hypothetical protein EDB82DRAFT_557240 [Fusarium venenatum]|uniref:uncharacterized protein n=1 Tax=Fusarium venenatum TaxID=56646 RepID=UPI001D35FF60|nr:hypothetical protein EDB82DRAFT_557240 [Fusarium venenatum]